MNQTEVVASANTAWDEHRDSVDPNRLIVFQAMELICAQRNSFRRTIQCEFHEGAFLIHGQVSTYFEKQLIQESIRSIPSIQMIINNAEVVPQAALASMRS